MPTPTASPRKPPSAPRDDVPPTTALGRVKHYFTHRVDPMTSVLLVIPLYLVYQIGTLLSMRCQGDVCAWTRNGVDFLTGSMLEVTHGSRITIAGIALLGAIALSVGALWARRRAKLHPRLFLPVLAESTLYALLVGPIVGMTEHAIGLGAPGSANILEDIVGSCGAGLHEELVFRVVLFSGGTFVLKKLGITMWKAVTIAAIVSSVVFSAVHHLGSLGEPFTVTAFVFRLLMGLLFAFIYRTRGFAIAAWTHALYDIAVFTTQRLAH